MMYYRTRTYIAGAWDESEEAIQQLYQWNEDERWALTFSDAHKLTQSRDTSLPCTIKDSLRIRLNASKMFVLVIGKQTNSLRKGGCQYCKNYHQGNFYYKSRCEIHKTLDTRSFIDYECEIAEKSYWKGEMKIVVLYDALTVDKSRCPKILKNIGWHIPMKGRNFYGCVIWDYQSIKNAIMQ